MKRSASPDGAEINNAPDQTRRRRDDSDYAPQDFAAAASTNLAHHQRYGFHQYNMLYGYNYGAYQLPPPVPPQWQQSQQSTMQGFMHNNTAYYPLHCPRNSILWWLYPAPFLEFATSKHQSVLEYLHDKLNLTNAKVYSHDCSRADLSTTCQEAGWTRRLDREWICQPCKALNHNKDRHIKRL